jgi:hypothetical protein
MYFVTLLLSIIIDLRCLLTAELFLLASNCNYVVPILVLYFLPVPVLFEMYRRFHFVDLVTE